MRADQITGFRYKAHCKGIYHGAGEEYAGHRFVNSSIYKYVSGGFWHTNTVESYCGIFRRGIIGNHRWVSGKHLKHYLAEFDFRHNYRKASYKERADTFLRGAKGKRLMYHQPCETANVQNQG